MSRRGGGWVGLFGDTDFGFGMICICSCATGRIGSGKGQGGRPGKRQPGVDEPAPVGGL